MTRTVFAADHFVATPHSTAEEKARFCAAFVRFVLRGFDRKLFKPDFYRRLSNIFGHIANYDADGFWELVRENRDDLKWCGSSPFYTFLKTAPRARGELLSYEQWNIDEASVVSFAGMSFSEPE